LRLLWRPLDQLPRGAVPDALRTWLAERHSLTQRLRHHCAGRLQVRVADQSWSRPNIDEVEVLGLRTGAIVLVRQVYLFCDDTPQVYARSVIPLATLTGAQRRLKRLGSRPLGDLLFADPNAERRPIAVTRLMQRCPLFGVALEHSAVAVDAIWGRRSVFRLQGKPLLVSEFFLPGLCPEIIERNRRNQS
jgi:chorismate--pyruvate lyase